MTSLIKNQILKHLTKFFKDLAPEQLQLSAFKGSCELNDLRLEEKVLMDLLSFPAWVKINKATCDQLSIKIPWTKIKSVPIQMNLNEVNVEVEVCEEFRDINGNEEIDANLANLISTQAPGKYGFVDRVIDGITVTVNNVLITFKSKLMTATFNLSRVLLESRCPNWKAGELSLTRIKDVNRGQILLFKVVEWQNMRLEAKCLSDPLQAPLRLITNHAQVRLTIKKQLEDCAVIAARIFVLFEDILWVLTFAQFTSAASFVEYVFTLIKRSPMSKKTALLDDKTSSTSLSNTSSTNNSMSSSFGVAQSAPLISPINTPKHSSHSDKAPILTGNMSSASLQEHKFLCYDLIETSLHFYIDKVDAHLYDDIEVSSKSSNRDSGGALQITMDQIQVDCYPYSRAVSSRKHWYKWFDPSPNSRKQWLNSHFAEFDLMRMQKIDDQLMRDSGGMDSTSSDSASQSIPIPKKQIATAQNEQLLSLVVLVKVKDYCMNCVATRHSVRGDSLNKFIQTDQDYHMPSDMPSIYLELNYFYYFDAVNHMMIYDDVPDPLAFIHLSPTKLLFDPPTLVFLNTFQMNLSQAMVHLNDLFPDETNAPKVHCRIEILMPQIRLPAKANPDQPLNASTSALLVKSGKLTLSNSIYDRNLLSKLMESIDKLKESPSQPISMGGLGGSHPSSGKKGNSCVGDWAEVWNASLINRMTEFSVQNQLWSIQFEPVWMDFMNYDVDDLSSGQRLEPIVEPFNAYAFIHLNLSSTFANTGQKTTVAKKESMNVGKFESPTKKRDIISILVSVMDGPILANMDKIQFSFLQRLGMHVEKLLQQIRADASSIIQLETIVEDTLEINLTAYIKDIKARLILDRKVEVDKHSVGDVVTGAPLATTDPSNKQLSLRVKTGSSSSRGSDNQSARPTTPLTPNSYFSREPLIANVFEETAQVRGGPDVMVGGVVYPAGDQTLTEDDIEGGALLDECVEVADDASCLLFESENTLAAAKENTPSIKSISSSDKRGNDQTSASSKGEPCVDVKTTDPIPTIAGDSSKSQGGKNPVEKSLLINLEEMEQSSSLFAKVDIKVKPTDDQPASEQSQVHQQEIETESISYLELSMSQLMVRRITETKRRQKF